MERIKPTQQIYSHYTTEDFAVWNILYNRQINNLSASASKDYLSALQAIGFCEDEIPDFSKMNAKLEVATGWKIITVPGICPPAEFFKLLSQKTFTATCWLRRMDELDYLEEPDMFHDVFGHVPLLTNKAYCHFFEALGKLAVAHMHDQRIIDMLERLYWFTIEFGMIKESGALKIYGAGIISSVGETRHALGAGSTKHAFDVEAIMARPFRTDVMQDDYFVINSFSQLESCLPQVEKVINRMIKTKTVM